MPVVARFYFIAYQIIVSQVFLNLFIAIVVDTFISMKTQFDLPVCQNDIDTFIECWKKYDPLATGYIDWRHLEPLLIELHESETSFFAEDPEQIMDKQMR